MCIRNQPERVVLAGGWSSPTWKILHAKKRDRTDFPLAGTYLELSVTSNLTADKQAPLHLHET